MSAVEFYKAAAVSLEVFASAFRSMIPEEPDPSPAPAAKDVAKDVTPAAAEVSTPPAPMPAPEPTASTAPEERYLLLSKVIEITGYGRPTLMAMIGTGQLTQKRGDSPKRPRYFVPEGEVLRLLEEQESANKVRRIVAGRDVVYPTAS